MLNKIQYFIIGRFEEGSKYGVVSKQAVEGYKIDEVAAVRKVDGRQGAYWVVDSFQTGIAIVTTGCKTRKAAIENYENNWKVRVTAILTEDRLKKYMEDLHMAPAEDELKQYEEVEYSSTHDWRIDKIQQAEQAAPAADPVQDTTPEKVKEIDVSKLNAENIADYLPALLMSLANDKHNSSIILSAGIQAGVIPPAALLEYFTTGRMPAVHTFDIWKKAGYNVKKGEKAAFTARIWKFTEKAVTLTAEDAAAMNAGNMIDGIQYAEGDTIQRGNFIKKVAFFFTAGQVEKAPELQPLPELPEDVKKESRGGCCWISGNTKPIKEDLKAAGFRWSKKNGAWYRREAA